MANRDINVRVPTDYIAIPVSGSQVIDQGAIVAIDTFGFAKEAADTAGLTCVGIAVAAADNTGGANGAVAVQVYSYGAEVLLPVQGTAPTYNAKLYAYDSEKVALTGAIVNGVAFGHAMERAVAGDGPTTYYWAKVGAVD